MAFANSILNMKDRSKREELWSMTEIALAYAKKALSVDGSLRDTYVLETDEQDWQKLLNVLHAGSYSVNLQKETI